MPLQSLRSGFSPTDKEQSSRKFENKNKCSNVAGLLKQKKKKITKRGRGNKNEKLLNIFSTNAAGLTNKVQSLKSELKQLNCGIFTIQDTHLEKRVN